MDINETGRELKGRHPWELSRTKSILKVVSGYLSVMHGDGSGKRYINVGAGDLYFDHALLKEYEKDVVYAVDIGYQSGEKNKDQREKKFRYLGEIVENDFDFAIMMDSLEYMEDDEEYVKELCSMVRGGGYLFFTVPAFQKLYSEHDVIVKNLRRYDRKPFGKMIEGIPRLEVVEEHYFYFSLLCVRWLQKILHMKIDPEHKVTTGWNFGEKSLVTRLVTGCLNFDFVMGRALSKFKLFLPGLSLLAICKKEDCGRKDFM